MRISELSRASDVPIPTIKFYLRRGLLPPGERTASNQARYSDTHLRRLRLIRVLAEVGGLGIGAIGEVLRATDDEMTPLVRAIGLAHHALGPPPDRVDPPGDVRQAREEVDRWIAARGWDVTVEAPSRRSLADALVALRRLGREVGPETFEPYAELTDRLAQLELERIAERQTRAEAVESVVVGTVVYEAALVALRRLAQEHHSRRRSTGGGLH